MKGQPTLNDYMDVQRKLAKEYGFHVIELYNIGFMDCTDKESADFYLRDGLHPKDNGNIVLGEHIAAELSLYFDRSKELPTAPKEPKRALKRKNGNTYREKLENGRNIRWRLLDGQSCWCWFCRCRLF